MANSENKTDKKATAKAAPKKTAAAKPAKTATAKPAAKAAASSKPAATKQNPSAEERYRMTEVAAYFMAERNNFAGSPVEYWQAAEAQINTMLGQK